MLNDTEIKIRLNGEALLNEFSLLDRGLQYGDGLFETIALWEGGVEFLEAHLARLALGCERLSLEMPAKELLRNEILALTEKHQNGVIKIILTRGVGGRGYCAPEDLNTTRILFLHPWPAFAEASWVAGIKTTLCNTRCSLQSALAGIKHLNRLENVLARNEWSSPDIKEGFLLDATGELLIEGTMSNLFVVANGALITPELSDYGVRGVMRANIIALAYDLGLSVSESPILLAELASFTEVFITNSLIGVWPVVTIDHLHYDVGSVTKKLMALVRTR